MTITVQNSRCGWAVETSGRKKHRENAVEEFERERRIANDHWQLPHSEKEVATLLVTYSKC